MCVAVYVCCWCCVNKYVGAVRLMYEASLFPACALVANTNPAPLEGHAHAAKSSQGTHLRTGRLHSRRSRERGRGPYVYGSSRDPEVWTT